MKLLNKIAKYSDLISRKSKIRNTNKDNVPQELTSPGRVMYRPYNVENMNM